MTGFSETLSEPLTPLRMIFAAREYRTRWELKHSLDRLLTTIKGI
jgi:hypothetical protein